VEKKTTAKNKARNKSIKKNLKNQEIGMNSKKKS